MHLLIRNLFLCLVMVLCGSCHTGESDQSERKLPGQVDREKLLDVNKHLIRQDAVVIRNYADNAGWDLKETGTGLFYQILDHGRQRSKAGKVKSGDQVSLNYDISVLDGTRCYTSTLDGPRNFVVDKSWSEQGLHEAVKLLEPGDSALIIMPPHLAYGLVGDGDRIPARAILVFKIRLVDVKRGSSR